MLAISLLLSAAVPLVSGGATQDGKKKEKTPLAKQMQVIGRAQRVLRKQMKELAENPSPEAFDAAVVECQKAQLACLVAKNEDPAQTPSVPKDKRRKFVADYRRAMKGFVGAWIDLEVALYERNYDAAQKAFKLVGAQKRPGHTSFKKSRDW